MDKRITKRRPKAAYPSLKEWREDLRLSQREAAELLEISQKSYSRLERGDRYVKGPIAQRVMERTGVPLETLVGVAL